MFELGSVDTDGMIDQPGPSIFQVDPKDRCLVLRRGGGEHLKRHLMRPEGEQHGGRVRERFERVGSDEGNVLVHRIFDHDIKTTGVFFKEEHDLVKAVVEGGRIEYLDG